MNRWKGGKWWGYLSKFNKEKLEKGGILNSSGVCLSIA